MNNKEFFSILKSKLENFDNIFIEEKYKTVNTFSKDREILLASFYFFKQIISHSNEILLDELNLFPSIKKILQSMKYLENHLLDNQEKINPSILFDFITIDRKILMNKISKIAY